VTEQGLLDLPNSGQDRQKSRQNRTGRTGLKGLLEKAAQLGLPRQDCQDRAVWTRLPDRATSTGLLGQDGQGRIEKVDRQNGQAEQERQKGGRTEEAEGTGRTEQAVQVVQGMEKI
jgi:hypothetical protein